MRGRTISDDPRTTGRERPGPGPRRETEGAERERRKRERKRRLLERERPLTRQERSERALADAHFGGQHREARRAVNTWIPGGFATEFAGKDAGGAPYALFSSTAKGASVLRDLAEGQGIDPGQRFSYILRFRRARLEGELRGTVFGRSLAARHNLGQRAADTERHRAAAELGLPVGPEGQVLYPDLQIEYVDPEGRSGRVNVEVASDHYDAQQLGRKVAAGFRIHASGPRSARVLASLRSGGVEL